MIRFWKRAKSIGFILNQTTRSLKDRASLLKSRRGQGHMSNFSQERSNLALNWSLEVTDEFSASDSLGEPTSVDVTDLV
jgi:hypothetical protein